jgi:membrane protease YdiL (CAAX protease family)
MLGGHFGNWIRRSARRAEMKQGRELLARVDIGRPPSPGSHPMRLLTYFLLTFLTTWSIWFAAAGLAEPGNTGFFGGYGPVFLVGVFAPGLIAVALTAREEGRAGISRLLARIAHWRVGAHWYLFAVVYFAAIKLAAAVAHRIVTDEWPRFGDVSVVPIILAIATSTWVQAGEEIGWRGYALPRLAKRLGLAGGSLVLGAVWAVWHLPLFFLPDSGSTGQSFPVYLLQVMAMSVAMAFVYWRTNGSLLLVMLMHASVNNTTGIVPAAIGGDIVPIALRGSLVGWATVVFSWIVAMPLLIRMRNANIEEMV